MIRNAIMAVICFALIVVGAKYDFTGDWIIVIIGVIGCAGNLIFLVDKWSDR